MAVPAHDQDRSVRTLRHRSGDRRGHQPPENLATAHSYLEGRGAFPERAALNQSPGRFLTELDAMVARSVECASDVVETWPDDVTEAPLDQLAAEDSVRSAASIPAMLRPDTP